MGVALKDVCGYYPTNSHLPSLMATSMAGRILQLGDEPADPGASVEMRWIPPDSDTGLAQGTYWVRRDGQLDVLIVHEGTVDQAYEQALLGAAADNPARIALLWLDHWWDAASVIPAPRFEVGQPVLHRQNGRDTTIQQRIPHRGGWSYKVILNAARQTVSEDLLAPIGNSLDPSDWVLEEAASVAEFASTVTKRKLTSRLTDTLFSYGASRTVFRPYQFKPVLRYLDSAVPGLLIADEVGLGKTISAGLYWTELAARGNADRVLVVCPSALVLKWQREMQNRFNFDLRELTSDVLRQLVQDLREDRLPPRFAYVCSIERLRRFDGLTELNDLNLGIDLVVVDEAHQMRNAGTLSNELGLYLSMWAEQLLFLSATPLSLGDRDLFNLMHLLSPADVETQADLDLRLAHHGPWSRLSRTLLDPSTENDQRRQWLKEIGSIGLGRARRELTAFQELESLFKTPTLPPREVPRVRNALAQLHGLQDLITRTRKAEVEESKPVREPKSIEVLWTDDERDFYDTFQQWAADVCRREEKPLGFAMQMPLRQAGSCLPVLAARIRTRAFDEGNEDSAATGSGRSMLDNEPPPPELVGLTARLGNTDSKFDVFLPELRKLVQAGKQVLLFTFSRGTLAYLERRLRAEFHPAVLHGGVRKEDRDKVMSDFRDGTHRVLLATRVASEGLDFEFCSVVVNYDLPWNPMEVEQRIGRIDRIGQSEEKIQIWNFRTDGTIETRIVERLLDRIGIFKHAIGELEPIVEENFEAAMKAALNFTLSPEERETELKRAEAALEQNAIEQAAVAANASRMQAEEWFSLDDVQRRIDRGRFVGPLELANLVARWVEDEGAGAEVDTVAKTMTIRFSQQLLHTLVAWRRGSGAGGTEVNRLEMAGRENSRYTVVLDAEVARTHGGSLLNVNHPLVQAAMAAPRHRDRRWSSVCITDPSAPAGRYLVLMAIATWQGLRPAVEAWTEAIDLDTRQNAGDTVGSAFFTALSQNRLRYGALPDGDLDGVIAKLESRLERRRQDVEAERRRENESLILERELRAKATFDRKRNDMQQRIAKSGGQMRAAFEGQIRRAQYKYDDEISRIEESRLCGLGLEMFAVCAVEITHE